MSRCTLALAALAAAWGLADRVGAQDRGAPAPPATQRQLDSLRRVARELTVREAELSARLALLHRDALALALDPGLPPSFAAEDESSEDKARAMRLHRDLFYTVLGAGVYANAVWHIDVDVYRGPRPLVDQYTGYHFTAGVTLEQLGYVMRVPARWRLPGVCVTAELFEYTQGQVDHIDAAFSCAGALLSAAARRLLVGR
jgi:hypothetical protein